MLPSTDNPSNLAQAHRHLSTAVEILWEIDQGEPAAPGEDAALSQAGAIVQNVCDHLTGLQVFSEVSIQITALEDALDSSKAEGFSAPDPGNLEWYEGDDSRESALAGRWC